MENDRKPVSLQDGCGGFNNYIRENVIPKMLKVLEESGLSYNDAKLVPGELAVAIEVVCTNALESNRFALSGSAEED